MITDYKIIKAGGGPVNLEIEVVEWIRKGWQPIGGVAVDQNYHYQAMVEVTEE